jgi:hypothetical protein
MPTPSFILPTSVPVVDATVEALRVYDGSPAGFDVLPMSFTRASTATRTDSAGNVVSAVPYNIFTYSEQLENILWLKNNITITANADTAPNGLVVADSYLSSVTVGPHPCYQSNVLPSNTYTYSVYAKKVNSRYISLKGAGGRFIWAGVIFDLDTATVVSIQNNNIPGVTGNVSSVGGGWYRISMTATRNFNDFGLQYASSPSNTFGDYGDLVIAGSGVVDYMLWGMQAVVGTEPLPYQETVTRLALPRLDYRNADGTLSSTPRLLLEPQRTNSIRNSTMVGAAAGSPGTLPTNWALGGGASGTITRTIVGVGVENGLTYLDVRYQGNAVGQLRFIQDIGNSQVAVVGNTITTSAYLKLISGTSPQVQLVVSNRDSANAFLSDNNGPLVTLSNTLTRYTYSPTIAQVGTAFAQMLVQWVLPSATYDFTIRIAAPQMELGSYATTFIPTTTAAVTRLADTCSLTGASSIIGQAEGTIFAEVNLSRVNTDPVITISDGSDSNRIQIAFLSSTQLLATVRISGFNANLVVSIPTIPAAGGVYKIALGYKVNDFCFSLNGINYTSTTARAVPACSVVSIGTSATAASFLGDQVTKAALYTTRLLDSELQSLTTL